MLIILKLGECILERSFQKRILEEQEEKFTLEKGGGGKTGA